MRYISSRELVEIINKLPDYRIYYNDRIEVAILDKVSIHKITGPPNADVSYDRIYFSKINGEWHLEVN